MTSKFFIPVRPIPASRPRISKFGSYYSKNYTQFRKELYAELKKIAKEYKTTGDKTETFKVTLDIVCYRPKKPANDYPRGDNDNFAKGYLDGFTYAEMFWDDDIQVVDLRVTKRYQEKDEDYGCYVTVEKL